MKDSIQLYQQNFYDVPQPIFFLDTDFKFIYFNKLCRKFFGDEYKQISGKYLYDIVSWEHDLKSFLSAQQNTKETILLQNCFFRATETPYLMYLNPIDDDKQIRQFYYCGFRAANIAMENNKNIYYEIFDKLGTGIVHGEYVTIMDVNSAFLKLTGLSREEVVGKSALKLVSKMKEKTDFKYATKLIRDFLLQKRIDKAHLPFGDKILEISTTESKNTVMLRDITEEKKQMARLQDLHEVAQKLAENLTRDEYYDIVLKASSNILDFSIASIIVKEDDHLLLYKSTQPIEQLGQKLNPQEGIYGKTYRNQQTYVVNDLKKDKDAKPTHAEIQSTLSIPIDKFGVFQTHSTRKNAFSENDVKMAELMITHLKQALYRIESQKDLKQKDKKYRALFENTAISTVMIDIQGTIRLANDRFMEYIQNENNIINHNIMAFFPGDSALELKKKIGHIVATDFHETIIMQAKMVTCRKISKRTICYIKMLPGNQQILISIADITQLKNYEDKLNRSLQEKNILLKEIHHRVKNNLQLVSSFIRIYLNSLDHFDKEKIIKEINSKINSVGIVHERLYKSDSYKDISIKKYIQKLVPELLSTYRDRKIRIKYDLEDIYINLNKSIPLGLILSEVVTNSIKYAFPENYTGDPEIGVSLRKSNKFYHFKIYDNGVGLDSEEKSFGHELIAILTQQLNGNSRFHNDHGVIFELEIPCKY